MTIKVDGQVVDWALYKYFVIIIIIIIIIIIVTCDDTDIDHASHCIILSDTATNNLYYLNYWKRLYLLAYKRKTQQQ